MTATKKTASRKAPAKATAKTNDLFPQVNVALQQALDNRRYFMVGQIAKTYDEFLKADADGKNAVMNRRLADLKMWVAFEFTHDVDAAADKKKDALMAAGRDGKYNREQLEDALDKLHERTAKARRKALDAANWDVKLA